MAKTEILKFKIFSFVLKYRGETQVESTKYFGICVGGYFLLDSNSLAFLALSYSISLFLRIDSCFEIPKCWKKGYNFSKHKKKSTSLQK